MGELTQVLNDVRNKIAQYQGKEMNEQNTKRALIDPVLCALGWEVGNLEEVSQEYKRKPQDKPVDYALFLLRTPKLFVEAKALRQDLDDRKWTSQIMGYAAVAGVKWTVITNGDEYRIYNACVDVPVEEKLFRSVRITDDHSPAEETLALLSKERIRDNDIEILWKAHFVDRQVRTALEQLFAPDPDPSLTKLVKKRVGQLSPKEIRASLARVRAQFDFPVEPESPPVFLGKRKRPERPPVVITNDGKAHKAVAGVSLKEVIDAGLLKLPLKLTVHYKSKVLEGDLLSDGTVRFQGEIYKTCSAAGDFARSTVTGRRMNTNGWTFWRYLDPQGKLVLLDTARQEYMNRKAK
jgi:hypothetical protein